MSSTQNTLNYGLPIFNRDDIPSWLTDWNGTMRKIDELLFNSNTDINELKTKTDKEQEEINGVNERVKTLEETTIPNISTNTKELDTRVTNLEHNEEEQDENITNLVTLCGSESLETTAKTLTGAVNELKASVSASLTPITRAVNLVLKSSDITSYDSGSNGDVFIFSVTKEITDSGLNNAVLTNAIDQSGSNIQKPISVTPIYMGSVDNKHTYRFELSYIKTSKPISNPSLLCSGIILE